MPDAIRMQRRLLGCAVLLGCVLALLAPCAPAHADEGYRTLTTFMSQARAFVRPRGRILLNFGTSGDIDYLYQLIDQVGFEREAVLYGEASRVGLTAQYYTIKLTAPEPIIR